MDYKNYYKILHLQEGETNSETIKSAYQSLCTYFHPTNYDAYDCDIKNIDICEAYLVLSDKELKQRYDSLCFSSDGNNVQIPAELIIPIKEKRSQAEEFISNFFSELENYKKKKKKSIIFIILTTISVFILIPILAFIAFLIYMNWPGEAKNVTVFEKYKPTQGWVHCTVNDNFSFSVPQNMKYAIEDRPDSLFSLENDNAFYLNDGEVISFVDESALQDSISFIMTVFYEKDSDLEYLSYNETQELNNLTRKIYEEIIAASVNYSLYSSAPEYRWVDIDGTKALDYSYAIPVDSDRAKYNTYFLFNNDEAVTLTVSFLESKSELAKDVTNVIRTIYWIHPK